MSTWPSDHLPRRLPFELNPGVVRAYFLSPSADKFRLVELVLRSALDEACRSFGLEGILGRAVDSKNPAVIHDEIWDWLYNADLLVFDITEENSSVMMELGVAAAWRLKPQIIVIQDTVHERPLPFNLSPARVLKYAHSPDGLSKLQREAQQTFQISLSTLPVAESTRYPHGTVFPFNYPKNGDCLVSSPLCHRYQRPDGGLEFGAPFDFRHSFLLPHTGNRDNVSMCAEMSFESVERYSDPNSYWIGIKVLSSGVLMNFGIGAVLYSTGRARVTYLDGSLNYKDPFFDKQLPIVDPKKDRVNFRVNVCGGQFIAKITHKDQTIEKQLNLGNDDYYRPTSGVCLIQAYQCRGVLWALSVGCTEEQKS